MSVTNCDAHFFMLVICLLFARRKEVLIFGLFLNLRFMIYCYFLSFSIMRQYLYNNQVVCDSSSSMDLSIVP